jgi:DNA invertase Pin-like site-specific DNA recombinase
MAEVSAGRPIRIGYARCSTARQESASQLAALEVAGIQLELLSGPLTGIYDPNGMGAMLFAVLAVAAQLDREYIREKTLG